MLQKKFSTTHRLELIISPEFLMNFKFWHQAKSPGKRKKNNKLSSCKIFCPKRLCENFSAINNLLQCCFDFKVCDLEFLQWILHLIGSPQIRNNHLPHGYKQRRVCQNALDEFFFIPKLMALQSHKL